jgi:hypothetical protein
MQAADVLLAQIAAFEPVNDDWRPLDDVLGQLWLVGVREEHLRSLFAVFERFPDEDGAGVLWGIVHGIEHLPFDYRVELDQSIARRPSLMANLMRQRLKKSVE